MIKIVKGDFLDANVYLVEKNNQILIIDSGADLEKIKDIIGSKKVVGVLLTHGHYVIVNIVMNMQIILIVKFMLIEKLCKL